MNEYLHKLIEKQNIRLGNRKTREIARKKKALLKPKKPRDKMIGNFLIRKEMYNLFFEAWEQAGKPDITEYKQDVLKAFINKNTATAVIRDLRDNNAMVLFPGFPVHVRTRESFDRYRRRCGITDAASLKRYIFESYARQEAGTTPENVNEHCRDVCSVPVGSDVCNKCIRSSLDYVRND